MRTYIIRRLLLIIPTLLIVSIAVFLLIRLIPGDIIDAIIAEQALIQEGTVSSELDRGALEKQLGLDKPVWVQYGKWIGGIIRGDLGTSLRGHYDIREKLMARLPTTFKLGILAIMLGLLVALPIGIYSAIRQDTIGDYLGRSLSIIFISVPSFWIGTMIMIYPALWWKWSPPMELLPFRVDPLAHIGMFIIPAAVLGMILSGGTMRMTRAMMLEVLRQDYIRTAWSKGLKERAVIVRHAIRNAIIPVVTLIGYQVPIMVGGSVIIEQLFLLPGIGRLMINSLSLRDYTVVSAINLVVATVILLTNLLVDLTYAYLDPRIRYG